MDLNLLRAILTTICFISFLLIVFWAYGPKSKQRFNEATNLPFDDQEMHKRSALKESFKQEKKQNG